MATAHSSHSSNLDPRVTSRPETGAPVIGCILTKNEERNVRTAVTSMQRAADAVFVVDSFSDDATVRIARECGATVVEHEFETYAAQRNWALQQIAERWGPDAWAFTLDADEWLSDELVDELVAHRHGAQEADIYITPIRRRFDGRILRHGGYGRTWGIRMWRAGYSAYGDRGVNEALVVPEEARIVHLEGWLEHADVDSWEKYIAKHNVYSTVEASARLDAVRGVGPIIGVRDAVRDRTVRRRFLRQRVWDRLPARPAIRFLQIYVFFGGFLDGRPGFERALFDAWQELCVDLKVRESSTQP